MIDRDWKWRAYAALLGTLGYWLLYRPNWRNAFIALYDIPTLLLAFSFAGSTIQQLGTDEGRAGYARLVALGVAVVLGWGAQYRGWPISGHLTVALTAGIIEIGDTRNPVWLRGYALVPALLVVLIRTFWPQTDRMGDEASTLAALVMGGLLGAGGWQMGR